MAAQVLHRKVELGSLVVDVERERIAVARRGADGVLAAVALRGLVDQARGRLTRTGRVRQRDSRAVGHDLGIADEVGSVQVRRWHGDLRRSIAEGDGVTEREVPEPGAELTCGVR